MTMQGFAMVFYVPGEHAEAVKEALFAAGAGRIGAYDRCCWQAEGTGQFRPLPGSDPFIGDTDRLERVPETRVEMVCAGEFLDAAVAALKAAHPYETPAFMVWPIDGLAL